MDAKLKVFGDALQSYMRNLIDFVEDNIEDAYWKDKAVERLLEGHLLAVHAALTGGVKDYVPIAPY